MSDEAYKDAFRKPQELLAFAGLTKTDTVLDVSTCFGYLAKHIAATGAAHVDAHNASEWRELFESFGIQKAIDAMEGEDSNIKHYWESFEDAGLSKNNEYDLITMQNCFHDLYDLPVDRSKFFASIKKALKPQGRFLLVDHKAGPGRGSQDTKELHRVEESVVRNELEANGLAVIKSSDMFSFPSDDYEKSAWREPSIETDRFVLLCEKATDSKEATDPEAVVEATEASAEELGEKKADEGEPPPKKSKAS